MAGTKRATNWFYVWLSGATFGFGIAALLFNLIEGAGDKPQMYFAPFIMFVLSLYSWTNALRTQSWNESQERHDKRIAELDEQIRQARARAEANQ